MPILLNVMWMFLLRLFAASVIALALYIIGCSETYFGSLNRVSCEDFANHYGAENCDVVTQGDDEGADEDEEVAGKNALEFNYNVKLGEVDIIFVVDNSSSMSREHKSLAQQMKNFLTDIKNLDYRIAIITTDISSSPDNNVRGASYQDGQFLEIGNSGSYFLEQGELGKQPLKEAEEDFANTLVREETLLCDQKKNRGEDEDKEYFWETGTYRAKGGTSSCPSSDERAIYALNLAVENTQQKSFFRRDAHLMVVIISDEDERSSEKYIEQQLEDGKDYTFELKDYPETLVETVYHHLGPLKTFSVHSIVIPPVEGKCFREQQEDTLKGGRGFPGKVYASLSYASDPELIKHGNLLQGEVISICDRNYSAQLSRVAIYAQVPRISIPCSDPRKVSMSLNGANKNLPYEIENRSLAIQGGIPLSSELNVTVICDQ